MIIGDNSVKNMELIYRGGIIMIRCINWNYKPIPDVSWIPKNEIADVLHCWEDAAMDKLKETGADHVVYAYKKYYNKNGEETFELNFMMTPLSDEEFHKRTSCFGTDYLVYALHKGTNFRK